MKTASYSGEWAAGINMGKDIRTAVIGVGAFGQNHARIVSRLDGVKLVAVADSDSARGREIAAKLSTEYFERYEDIAGLADAVVIVTPTSLHYDIASFFASKGIHVFVEKPVTSSSSEALKLVQLAKDKNVTLKVGHIERFNPAWLSVRSSIKEPLFIEARRISPFPERIKDSDVIIDMMIHDIDLVLDLVKSPVVDLKAIGMKVLTERYDMAQVWMEFENGSVANITASRVSANKFRKLRVFEKERYFSMDFLSRSSSVTEVSSENGKKALKIFKPDVVNSDSLQMELLDFFSAIRGEASRGVDGDAAASALMLAERIVSEIRTK
jgi:predicted dehydrogenase